MWRNKKWNLVVIGSIALAGLTALVSCIRRTELSAGTNPPLVLTGHQFPVQSLTFAHDGTTLTSAAYYVADPAKTIEVTDWDVPTGKPAMQDLVPLHAFRCLALAPRGRVLTAPREDGSLWLWERGGPQPRRLDQAQPPVSALAFSPDGCLLAAVDRAHDLLVWELASGRRRAHGQGPPSQVCFLAFAPDGKMLARSTGATPIQLWDLATGELRTISTGHTQAISALAFSPDGRTLASGDWDGVVELWDVATRTMRALLATSREPLTARRFFEETAALSFAPDGHTLAVARGRVVQLWDTATATQVGNLVGHEGKVKCLAFSPDGTRLASGSHDRTVRLWDVTRYGTMNP
jgi:WD40 repeat protein